MQQEDFRRDRPRYPGIAVAVAADPRPKRQPTPRRLDRGIMPPERTLHVGMQTRQGFEQRRVKIPQPRLRFIRHLRPGRAATIGQPQRGDLPLDTFGLQQRGIGQQRGLRAQPQDLAQSAQLREQGSPLRFRRVCRKHELDHQPVHQGLHRGRTHSASFQFDHRRFNRFTHRRARRAFFAAGSASLAQQHDAKILFGEVHQLEIERERHRLVKRLGRTQLRDPRRQTTRRFLVTRTPGLGQLSQGLDGGEGLRPLQSGDHAAERAAERTHLGSERGDFVGRDRERRRWFWHEFGAP